MKKELRGNFTVEAAVIIPLIMMVFVISLHVLFYYHDKNILMGTAHETVAYGAGLEATEEATLETYFNQRIKGKLMLFTRIENEIRIEDKKVSITCTARKSLMSLQVEGTVNRTNPENYIREVRKIKKIGEGIGNQN